MSRKQPPIPPPEVNPRENPDIVAQTRAYRVITPLYGGGVEPEKADPITIVRATEVRGHLRFWWRATRGGEAAFDGEWKKMREREEEIWGSAGEAGKPGPSKVTVSVIKWNEGKVVEKIEVYDKKKRRNTLIPVSDPKSPWSYVTFPLRETEEKPEGSVRQDVSFVLEIVYPSDLEKDIQAALWAWEVFGGIGGRTRRGLGSLQHTEKPSSQEVQEYISKGLNKHVVSGKWPVGVPHLGHNMRIKLTKKESDAIKAWEYLFGALQRFRQQRYGKFGLSQWPEANEIRKLHGKPSKSPKNRPSAEVVNKFPRAKFGLPIQFHMPHDKDLPETLTLQGQKISDKEEKWYDRLGSPLILRPIACSDGAVGLAAILEWTPIKKDDEQYTPPGGLALKNAPKDPSVKSDLNETEAGQIPPLKGEPDILQAFLDYLE